MATRIRRIIAKTGGKQANTNNNNINNKNNKRSKAIAQDSSSDSDDGEDLSDSDMSDEEDDDGDDPADESSDLTDGEDEDEDEGEEVGEGVESLLGSADSDDMHSDLEEEEERFIIQDLARRRAKVEQRRKHSGTDNSVIDKQRRAIDEALMDTKNNESTANDRDDDDAVLDAADDYPDDASGSLSPETLHQLGLDDLLDGADGFESSSEPSFTDFFDESASEDGTEDGVALEARSDDLQLTTDDDESETDISDLEDGLLSAPILGDALAAGVGTQLPPGAEQSAQADIPLLVIEDLDGRLIYARAGDGEAVFGSDGEFEYVDDSEDDYSDMSSDAEDGAYNGNGGFLFSMDGMQHDSRMTRRRMDSGMSSTARWNVDADDETDEGDTTDELPNEDMPFPRLLVGSVAPHGGRNARRARALAARSRRISPNNQALSASGGAQQGRKHSTSSTDQDTNVVAAEGAQNSMQDVNFSISTDDLARDPQATLEAAAQQLGMTVHQVAQLVIGMNPAPLGMGQSHFGQAPPPPQGLPSVLTTPVMNANQALPPVVTPDNYVQRMPRMGSFMPTSSKSVHRAVIDGSRQAPSPFTNRFGTQRKGLANRKRARGNSTPSVKRARREDSMTVTDAGDRDDRMAAAMFNNDDDDDDEAMDVDAMGLDDVMDASMLWRGGSSYPSSPPAMQSNGGDGEKGSAGKKSPSLRTASTRSPKATSAGAQSPTKSSTSGLNLNAVARWHRISMSAFREGQVVASSGSHRQPLGEFLMTRARGGQTPGKAHGTHGARGGRGRDVVEHSPFRGRARGASIHLNEAPKPLSGDAFMVSPVLWPSRHGSSNSSNNSNNTSNANGYTSFQSSVNQAGSHRGQRDNGKAMMTRREKRERKARKAALKSALRNAVQGVKANTATDSPVPTGFLPDFDVTEASPRPSPVPNAQIESKQLTGTAADAAHQANGGKGGGDASSNLMHPTSSTTAVKATSPIDIPASANGHLGISGAGVGAGQQQQQQQHHHQSSFASNSSSSVSSQHQPPSSVFGMPLHSPLFGSLLNPPNLGFRDDLDDRDEDGILTI